MAIIINECFNRTDKLDRGGLFGIKLKQTTAFPGQYDQDPIKTSPYNIYANSTFQIDGFFTLFNKVPEDNVNKRQKK